MNKSEIIPAILPKSFSDLSEKLSLVSGLVTTVQIDVCDGKLTPEKTWPYIRTPDPDFARIIREEEGFPFWEDLSFEVDLMVANPESVAQQWVIAGASRVIFHRESFASDEECAKAMREFKERFSMTEVAFRVSLGLAFNIDTPIEGSPLSLEQADFVQCMGIAKIGFQGQPFDERVLAKILECKNLYPDKEISVDGGVDSSSIPKLLEAGASRLAVGSAIFRSDDIADTIEMFKHLKAKS